MGDVLLTAGKLVAGTILTAAGAGNWGIPLILGGGAEVLGKVAGALLSKQPLSTVNVARGIEGNLPSLLNSVPIVYGERRVGLQLCDVIQQGTNNEELYLVGAVCRGSRNGGDIGGFRELYIDDRLAIDASGTVQSPFTGKVQRWTRGGSESQNPSGDSVLMGLSGSTYTALDRGLGVAYVIVRLVYDPNVFPGGIPQLTQVVRGEVCFDPRDSTWKWTANPALHLLDRLKRHGVPDDELDLSSFSTEANYYDETVTRPDASTGPRSSCNIVLDAEENCDVHLDRLRATCRAHLIFQGGVFRCSTRRVKSPASLVLTQDLFAGADWTVGDAGITQTPNLITYSWVDPAQQWAARPGQWPAAGASNGFLAADQGIPAIVSLDLGGVTDGYQAEQLAMIALREGRLGLRCSATFQEPALQLVPDDLVRVTHDAAGWNQKLFWVDSVALQLDGCVRLELTEYDASAYSLDAQTVPTSPPATQLPDPFTVQPPTGLALAASLSLGYPNAALTWTASPSPFVRTYEVQAKRSSSPVWLNVGPGQTTALRAEFSEFRPDVPYDARVRAVNAIGVTSDWATVTAVSISLDVFLRLGANGVDVVGGDLYIPGGKLAKPGSGNSPGSLTRTFSVPGISAVPVAADAVPINYQQTGRYLVAAYGGFSPSFASPLSAVAAGWSLTVRVPDGCTITNVSAAFEVDNAAGTCQRRLRVYREGNVLLGTQLSSAFGVTVQGGATEDLSLALSEDTSSGRTYAVVCDTLGGTPQSITVFRVTITLAIPDYARSS